MSSHICGSAAHGLSCCTLPAGALQQREQDALVHLIPLSACVHTLSSNEPVKPKHDRTQAQPDSLSGEQYVRTVPQEQLPVAADQLLQQPLLRGEAPAAQACLSQGARALLLFLESKPALGGWRRFEQAVKASCPLLRLLTRVHHCKSYQVHGFVAASSSRSLSVCAALDIRAPLRHPSFLTLVESSAERSAGPQPALTLMVFPTEAGNVVMDLWWHLLEAAVRAPEMPTQALAWVLHPSRQAPYCVALSLIRHCLPFSLSMHTSSHACEPDLSF